MSAPAADAVWSRRSDGRHVVVPLLGALLLGCFVALGVHAFLTYWDGVERVIGGLFTGLFLGLLLLFVVVLVRRLIGGGAGLPAVALDASGVWYVRGPQQTLVPWSEIAGVGIGYLHPPTAVAVAGSSLAIRKNFALEVFLRGTRPESLAPWSATEPAPRPDLPTDRVRYVLLASGDRHDLQAAVERHAPTLWLGEYERRWTALHFLNQ
ncbi:hypothetical protein [Tenggerimyces flavus]|uniref:Uncharacterized protein n=1 Tax=Tenggerimyces flavus TaxID=1708749 RepID=A0ABV7YKM2_9ACTN|nr:hypothetical protein [Tenggerimyces flavus]MBM7784936.1 hypothetical protein [Tenggerimyces flavus]